jgi:hypothetical protein
MRYLDSVMLLRSLAESQRARAKFAAALHDKKLR